MKIRSKLVSVVLVAAMVVFTAYQGMLGLDTDRQHANVIKDEQEADSGLTLSASDNKETIHLWYTDEALTDYLGSCALHYMEENDDVRVVPSHVSAVEYLERINEASTQEEIYPDLYVVTNDCLEKAYLSGLTTEVEDAQGVISTDNFSDTAISAVTYEGQKVAYPFYFETSLFLYNKSYLESMALAKAQALADEEEGQRAQEEADALAASGQEEVLSSQNSELSEEEQAEAGNADGQNTAEQAGDGQTEPEQVESEQEEIYEQEGESILDHNDEEISESLIPATFNEILTLADEYDAPQEVEAILNWDVSDVFYNYFFAGNYMNVGGKDGDDPAQIDINNEQVVECLNVYQGLNQFFSIDAKETDYAKTLQAFIEGKSIFTVATTDAIAVLEQAKEDGSFAWEYGIAEIPNVTKELVSRGLSVTNVVAVNGFGEHRSAADAFASYLVTRADGELYTRAGKPAAYKKVQHDNEKLALVMQAYEQSTSLPKLMRASNFWVQLEAAYTDIWNGKDTKTILDALQQQMQHQIQE